MVDDRKQVMVFFDEELYTTDTADEKLLPKLNKSWAVTKHSAFDPFFENLNNWVNQERTVRHTADGQLVRDFGDLAANMSHEDLNGE